MQNIIRTNNSTLEILLLLFQNVLTIKINHCLIETNTLFASVFPQAMSKAEDFINFAWEITFHVIKSFWTFTMVLQTPTIYVFHRYIL